MKNLYIYLILILFSFLSLQAQEILSEKEKEWLLDNSPIVLGVDADNPPMNFLNDQGEMEGLSIDYMDLIGTYLGIEFQYFSGSWSEALQAAMDHQVDGIINASIKEDRLHFLNFTESYFQTPDALLTLIEEEYYHGPASFQGKTIAVIKGSIRIDVISRYAPDVKVLEVLNLQEGVKAVLEGRAQGFLDELPVIQNLMEQSFYSSVKLNALFFFPELGTAHIGLRNNDPQLVQIINKGIAAIDNVDHNRIQSRYMEQPEGIDRLRDPGFTGEELRWLRENPVIKVGSDAEWAPMEYSEQGIPKGMAMDYLLKLEQIMGVEFQIFSGPWSEVLERARKGEIDMLSCANRTPEREGYLDFTAPYMNLPFVLLARSDISYIEDLKGIESYRLGLLSGYASSELFLKEYPGTPYKAYPNLEQAIQALIREDIDLLVENQFAINRYLSQEGIFGLHIVGDTGISNDLSMAVQKDSPLLLSILTKSLNALDQEEMAKKQQSWAHITIKKELDYKKLWKISLLFLIILVLFFAYTVILTRRDRLRTAQLEDAKRMETIGNIAGGIAHDFKNILMGVSGYTELILRGNNSPEEVKEFLHQILNAVDSGTELSNRILFYTRESDPEMEKISLSELVEQTVSLLKQSASTSLKLDLEIEEDCFVIGDAVQLKRLVMNLGTNAVQSMDHLKQPILQVALKSYSKSVVHIPKRPVMTGPLVELILSDIGSGIPEKIQNRIYDPYFTTKNRQKGTGLGLALVKKILKNHNGFIHYSSNLEHGSTFYIYLPSGENRTLFATTSKKE